MVSISGNATLDTRKPVMLPPDENYIDLTQFRADWTDETAEKYVDSYTLLVSTKPAATLIADEDFSNMPSGGNVASDPTPYLPEGWTFEGSELWLDGACLSLGTNCHFVTRPFDLTGYDKATIIVRAKNDNIYASSATLAVETSVDYMTVKTWGEYLDYVFVMDCDQHEQFRIGSNLYYCDIEAIKIYAGELEETDLCAIVEEGDSTSRLITGITDKSYVVSDLEAGLTYYYKVKAVYTDGTESEWSNFERVTLLADVPANEPGDVNGDGKVTISDVTALINLLLTNGEMPSTADFNGDGRVTISDVTALVNYLLTNGGYISGC